MIGPHHTPQTAAASVNVSRLAAHRGDGGTKGAPAAGALISAGDPALAAAPLPKLADRCLHQRGPWLCIAPPHGRTRLHYMVREIDMRAFEVTA